MSARDRAGRLGRKVEHDPRSRAFPIAQRGMGELRTVTWRRRVPVFDQGSTSSCTGQAMAGLLATDSRTDPADRTISPADAMRLYSAATRLDQWPSQYPPDDEGSSGLAAAKAAKAEGRILGYLHAFNFQASLSALQDGPVSVGIDWKEGMDNPDRKGLARWTGATRGGHQFVVVGVDVQRQLVKCVNSWGWSWPYPWLRGRFSMTWDDFGAALDHQGDCTQMIRSAAL